MGVTEQILVADRIGIASHDGIVFLNLLLHSLLVPLRCLFTDKLIASRCLLIIHELLLLSTKAADALTVADGGTILSRFSLFLEDGLRQRSGLSMV